MARAVRKPESASVTDHKADTVELLLRVDTHVSFPCAQTPRKVIEALRRQLRQHEPQRSGPGRGPVRSGLRLLRTSGNSYRVPQALLARLVDVCRRHDVTYQVVEGRTSADCGRMRCHLEITPAQQAAVRQLLMRESGVVLGGRETDRLAVAAEVIARRQQRTLVLTLDHRVGPTRDALAAALGLAPGEIGTLGDQATGTRVTVGSYQAGLQRAAQDLSRSFGMLVFDDLAQAEVGQLMQAIQLAGARHLVGLSEETFRPDGLHGPLFLALGGPVHQLVDSEIPQSLRLTLQSRQTAFNVPYEGRAQYQAVLASLAVDPQRNQQIADDIAREAAAGRPCLVLSERREHLDRLYALLPQQLASTAEVITSNVRPAIRSAIVARFERGDTDILLATGQIVTDSVTIRRAQRLFIAFPFSYGRKLEKLVSALMSAAADKSDVIVFDYDDAHLAPLHNAFEKRAKIIARLQRSAERDRLRQAQVPLPLE